jgi:hypothetical protein
MYNPSTCHTSVCLNETKSLPFQIPLDRILATLRITTELKAMTLIDKVRYRMDSHNLQAASHMSDLSRARKLEDLSA